MVSDRAKAVYDRGRGDYSRAHGTSFNIEWHEAGLQALWNEAYEQGRKDGYGIPTPS